jgi:predicted transcriptional regulator
LTLEGLADIDAGRVVEHHIVHAWIESLETENPLPPPRA